LIRFPLAALARASGAEFHRASVQAVDLEKRLLRTDRGDLSYQKLILAPGAEANYYAVPGAAEHAVSLQTYEAAVRGHRRVAQLGLGRTRGTSHRVVVCGAGIEGLEVAAMVRQYASSDDCAVAVLEKGASIMGHSQCTDAQRRYVASYLARQRIDLRTGAGVRELREDSVRLEGGEALSADLVYWCAGVRRATLGGLGAATEPLEVDERLQCPEHPEVFAIGDFAAVASGENHENLYSAQRAIYQGIAAAENLALFAEGRPGRSVRYRPKGEFVALGDFDGVGVFGGIPVYGFAAAALKKAAETRYLTELYGDLPAHLLKTALG
jgi:NADH:ubiquinone reductase (H+-translocating)